jgi:hypothetical protein
VFPRDGTLTAALAPGGCLAGYAQARVQRHNLIMGLSASQAAALRKNQAKLPVLHPDIRSLSRLGWAAFLRQPHYLDAGLPAWSWRWSPKAFIDPEQVRGFDQGGV